RDGRAVAEDAVVRGDVAVADDLGGFARREVPRGVRGRDEAGRGVVVGAQQAGHGGQGGVVAQVRQGRVVGDLAGDEVEDLPALLVQAVRAGRAREAAGGEVAQQRVHGGRPRPGGPAHGVSAAGDL